GQRRALQPVPGPAVGRGGDLYARSSADHRSRLRLGDADIDGETSRRGEGDEGGIASLHAESSPLGGDRRRGGDMDAIHEPAARDLVLRKRVQVDLDI